MDRHESPLHIVSAQVAEPGITYAQQAVAGKSNEIPAVRELLEQLELGGCLVVADALNRQKETAKSEYGKKAVNQSDKKEERENSI